ncbi:MAG: DNA polymerase III subunit delta [Deltaproteobacteria bacterium]|nr:DNA polymerase III subunit delta [Deltaproteobacteria bacterium]
MPPRQDFDRALQSSELGAVYALVSAEPLLLSEAVVGIRDRVLKAASDFNRDEFRAGEVAVERVLDAATTLPMMAARRYVLFSDLQRLKTKDLAPLIAYLEKPAPTSVLVLTATELDMRTKLAAKLAAQGFLFLLEPPRPGALASWLATRARRLQLTLEPDAGRLLVDLLGADLGGLDMALGKLAAYTGGGAITSEAVEATVAPTKVDTIFKLTDALGARDLTRASLQLRNILVSGESAILVLSMITRQLRQLLLLKELAPSGRAGPDVASRLGVRPFVLDSLFAQGKRYDQAELFAALFAAHRADIRLRSSKLDAAIILEQLLVEVVEAHAAAPS